MPTLNNLLDQGCYWKAIQKHVPLKVFYRYEKPISLYICNYGKFLKNLTLSDIKNIIDTPCHCKTSPFNYPPLGHVLTGDLSIVANEELRKILSFGCKYRIPLNRSVNDIKMSILNDLDNFIKVKCIKYRLRNTSFSTWKKGGNGHS